MPTLNFKGKSIIRTHHLSVPYRQLVPHPRKSLLPPKGKPTLDDNLIVENNDLITSLDKIPKIWTSHYWAGKIDASDKSLYRPLTLTTYALQYTFFKENPVPYHILNILLHALVCFVLMKLIDLVFTLIQVFIYEKRADKIYISAQKSFFYVKMGP